MNADPNKALPFGANDRTIARKSAPPDLVITRIEYITAQRRVRALVASLVAPMLDRSELASVYFALDG